MKKTTLSFLCTLFFITSTYAQLPDALTVSSIADFFPEDITIVNDVAYVSSLGNGTVTSFDLTQQNPTPQLFAAAEPGYTQAWGLKSDGTVLLSLLNNADFTVNPPGPAKLVEYNIASGAKTGEWDLPANTVGHTVSIVGGKYYVTDFGFPQIMEIDPATDAINTSWFTSPSWDPAISGIGGTIYDNNGGFYISQGNALWYLPISGGAPGTLQQVTVSGLGIIDADGIYWDDSENTLYYATNDTGDPANVGTAYKLVFSDATTATGSVVVTDLDDSSGLWYYEDGGNGYVFVMESQFGALFGINSFDSPFNIRIIDVSEDPNAAGDNVTVYNSFEDVNITGGVQGFFGAGGPEVVTDNAVEFPGFIGFYDVDVNDCSLTMTLIDNSGASDLLLPDGRFDRYYFGFDSANMPNVSVSGGSPGLTVNASVTPLPPGYTVPVQDLFGTGYPLPITLPNGGFLLELGGGTDLTELGQTISVDFGCSTDPNAVNVPTMSEWGLIILSLLMLNFVFINVIVGKLSVQGFNNQTINMFNWRNLNTYPFNAVLFRRAINYTIGILILIAIFALVVYGFFTATDVVGLTIASPIFAYLLHLLLMANETTSDN